MKIFCNTCGAHFPEDFPKTVKSKCNFWELHGGATLPKEYKKKVWDWLFSFNHDQFALESGFSLSTNFQINKFMGNDFEKIKGYTQMTEEEQRTFQKDWFKFINKLDEKDKSNIFMTIFINSHKKWSKKLGG